MPKTPEQKLMELEQKVRLLEKQNKFLEHQANNGIIKQEFRLMDYILDIDTMKQLVRESIKTYNSKRPHLSCQMLTPEQMHKQSVINIKAYKNINRSWLTTTPV